VAPERRSRFPDELPAHARIEAWEDCSHMAIWDRPDDVVRAALALPA
jgi:pimeloyl-ACP methyl ester carboxylesterase